MMILGVFACLPILGIGSGAIDYRLEPEALIEACGDGNEDDELSGEHSEAQRSVTTSSFAIALHGRDRASYSGRRGGHRA